MSSSSSPLDLDNERMTIKLTATEVKEKIFSLLDQVKADQEVEITRRGRTIAPRLSLGASCVEGVADRSRHDRRVGRRTVYDGRCVDLE